LGQVSPRHAKQLRAQVELWCIPFLFLAKSFPPLLFRQTGALAPVLLLLEILLQQLITLRDLLLTKLVAVLFLLQNKQ
jgi:hypothetical protein